MAIDISQLNYVPTLGVKVSEMNALEELPSATKDLIQPLFLLAPWASSKNLVNTIMRIEKAFEERPFFLDIDRYYWPGNNLSSAKQEWIELLSPKDNYASWIRFLHELPNANPCVQIHDIDISELEKQTNELLALDRSIAFRFELARLPANFDQIVEMITRLETASHVIMVDGGWTKDALNTGLKIKEIVTRKLRDINPDIPIVVSYTTIPDGYTDVKGTKFTPFNNREVVEEIRQISNRPNIIYGDWGSTRPRTMRGPLHPASPRIDIATRSGWLSARNAKEHWDYPDAASTILNSSEWKQIGHEPIWGVARIKQTADSKNLGIHTAQDNVAARINIHLHVQAMYDDKSISPIDFDEEWKD